MRHTSAEHRSSGRTSGPRPDVAAVQELLGCPFSRAGVDGGDERWPHRVGHHPLTDSLTKSLTQVRRPGRAERVCLARRGAKGGRAEVPDDPPPEGVRGAFVGERVVDARALGRPASRRRSAPPGARPDAPTVGRTRRRLGPRRAGARSGRRRRGGRRAPPSPGGPGPAGAEPSTNPAARGRSDGRRPRVRRRRPARPRALREGRRARWR